MAQVGAASRIEALAGRILGRTLPIAVEAWDGSRAGPADGPVLLLRSRRAIRRLAWRPDEIGLGRGWVTGDLDVEGDLEEAMTRLGLVAPAMAEHRLTLRERLDVIRTAARLGVVGPPPSPPPEESSLGGRRHSRDRDRAAIRHHYDVGDEFYGIVLGPSMVYSCAYWRHPDDSAYTLDDAQRDKLDLICRKLGLHDGSRFLDVGCGWGSLVLHAAREYGVRAVGITLSDRQGAYAHKRVVDAGLADRVEIRVQDWRNVDDGPYDMIASIGMAEHLGAEMWAAYCRSLYDLLRPGGRLLNHQIVRVPSRSAGRDVRRRSFIDAYVFPDGQLIPIGEVVTRLEEAGLEVRDVESLREHYARTLRQWVANLEGRWDDAVGLAGIGRARVWRLYMTGSALAFDSGRIGVDQVLAVRPHEDGRSGLPMVRPVG
jgi:cyclopropane-fatty-acyl-phospholipid synthase